LGFPQRPFETPRKHSTDTLVAQNKPPSSRLAQSQRPPFLNPPSKSLSCAPHSLSLEALTNDTVVVRLNPSFSAQWHQVIALNPPPPPPSSVNLSTAANPKRSPLRRRALEETVQRSTSETRRPHLKREHYKRYDIGSCRARPERHLPALAQRDLQIAPSFRDASCTFGLYWTILALPRSKRKGASADTPRWSSVNR